MVKKKYLHVYNKNQPKCRQINHTWMVWIVNPEYVQNSSLLAFKKKIRCLKGKKMQGTHAMAFMGCKGDYLQINKCSYSSRSVFSGKQCEFLQQHGNGRELSEVVFLT